MKQYIDKTAVVAKLESKIKEWRLGNSSEAKYRCEVYKELSEWLNTLEVIKIGVDEGAPEWDKSTVYDTYPIMEPPHIVLANIDVAKMVKEKEKFLQQILLPFGYSEDHVEQMVVCYKQGIMDILEKIEEP